MIHEGVATTAMIVVEAEIVEGVTDLMILELTTVERENRDLVPREDQDGPSIKCWKYHLGVLFSEEVRKKKDFDGEYQVHVLLQCSPGPVLYNM